MPEIELFALAAIGACGVIAVLMTLSLHALDRRTRKERAADEPRVDVHINL